MEPSQNIRLSKDSLSNLLLDLEQKGSSVDLAITSSIGDASVLIRSGKLAEARFGDLKGLDAARTLLALREGSCAVEDAVSKPQDELGASLSDLVKGAARLGTGKESVTSNTSSTLAIGSRITLTDSTPPRVEHKKTLQSRVPSQARMPAVEGLSESRSFDAPRSWSDGPQAKHPFSTTVTGHPHKPVPARLMRQDHLTKGKTSYSSRPPPSLAEEHVPLPKSLRRVDALPKIEGITAHRVTPLVDPPTTAKGMASTLGAVTVVPDDGLNRPTAFVNDLSSDLPPDSPSSGLPNSRSPWRAPMPSNYDEEVVDAAEGQLSDSEMPLPSTRLSIEALNQLHELNEAVSSRRVPASLNYPIENPSRSDPSGHSGPPISLELASRPSWDPPSASMKAAPRISSQESSIPPAFSSESRPASSSDPHSYTGTHSYSQQPGSVPDPSALPGTEEERATNANLPRVGRYEVLSRLKRGGMGSVYMCRLSTTAGFRRLFAMKVLHSHLAQQEGAIEAFFHEARVLGGLHHRNIVGIADVGSPQQPYIVLDYVEGGSFAEVYRATRKAPRDPRLIVTVLLDALSGLHAAHQATDEQGTFLNLVHCDVTPHNLLVGIDGTCRLTDFGIARTGRVDPQQESTQGKPAYLAPERILRKPNDHRSDIFSAGVVLYTGITGVEPFTGNTPEATMRNVLEQPLLPPSQVGFRPSPFLDLICLKALARDPDERFQSAEEMFTQLRRVADREGMIASSAEVAAWVRKALAPTLKARRVASMRGAESSEIQRSRWQTMPPPVAVPGDPQHPSTNPPGSAQEKTGSLPPPSSRDFGDETQVLHGVGRKEGSRFKKLVTYVLLTASILVLVWVLLRPETVAQYIQMGPSDRSAPTALPIESPPTPAPPASREVDDDEEKVVIPDIVPPPAGAP